MLLSLVLLLLRLHQLATPRLPLRIPLVTLAAPFGTLDMPHITLAATHITLDMPCSTLALPRGKHETSRGTLAPPFGTLDMRRFMFADPHGKHETSRGKRDMQHLKREMQQRKCSALHCKRAQTINIFVQAHIQGNLFQLNSPQSKRLADDLRRFLNVPGMRCSFVFAMLTDYGMMRGKEQVEGN